MGNVIQMKLTDSKTVKFNLYSILATLLVMIGAYTVMPGLPEVSYVILGVASMLISEIITYTDPSGGWAWGDDVGNWTAGKWIYRVGNTVLIIFAYFTAHGWLLQAIALITPIIEIIIRRYGSATEKQQRTANMRMAA